MEHRRLLGCHKNSVVNIKGEAFHIKGIENIINKIINNFPPKSIERDAHVGIRGIQKSKYIGPENKHSHVLL